MFVVCSDLSGHRILHLRRFAREFVDAGFEVRIYVSSLYRTPLSRKKAEGSFDKLLQDLLEWEGVLSVDSHLPKDGVKRLKYLQNELTANSGKAIFFSDGENNIFTLTLFSAAANLSRRVPVKAAAYFFESSFLYRRPRFLELGPKVLVGEFLTYVFLRWNRVFASNVDLILHNDQRLIFELGDSRFVHLWELEPLSLQQDEGTRYFLPKHTMSSLHQFLGANQGKKILLQFGDLENRKGFSAALELASSFNGVAILRAGRIKPDFHYSWPDIHRMELLIKQNRLFSIDYFIEEEAAKEYLYSVSDFVLLLYENHFRTTGVLSDAIRFGRSVLASPGGLKERLVRDHQLGQVVYREDIEKFSNDAHEVFSHQAFYEANLSRLRAELAGTYEDALRRIFDLFRKY